MERNTTIFEKIAKFHETMDKMNDKEFGETIRSVFSAFSLTLLIGDKIDALGDIGADCGKKVIQSQRYNRVILKENAID